MLNKRAVIVGLGGVGSWIVQGITPFLHYSGDSWQLVLVDGDEYEEKNWQRQRFDSIGPKAHVQANWVRSMFPNVMAFGIPQYLAQENDPEHDTMIISDVIMSGDIIF